jgi:hypothetical protein
MRQHTGKQAAVVSMRRRAQLFRCSGTHEKQQKKASTSRVQAKLSFPHRFTTEMQSPIHVTARHPSGKLFRLESLPNYSSEQQAAFAPQRQMTHIESRV